MTLDPIAAFPAVASAAVIYRSSVQDALFRVYLPVLLLLPDAYTWGWPALSFYQYAIIPIGLTLCWWVLNHKWRVSWTDVTVFLFIGWVVISDFHANSTTDLLNRIVTPITLALFPYMAGKLLIEQTGLRIAVARRIVFLLFVVSIISVYEFRLGVNPFQLIFNRLFSNPDSWGSTQIRYGLGRTAGPFGQAILMGTIIAIGVLLHRYVTHFGLWEKRFGWFPNLRINKPNILLAVLICGSIMTLSRGPWIALAVGLAVASIGVASDRWRALRRVVVALVIGGTLVYLGGKAYVASSSQTDEEVSSVAYRTQLLNEYQEIALQRKVWGWGSANWPRVPGMASVDDWYLLLALMHGVPGSFLFGLMLIFMAGRLFWVGMFDTALADDQRALLFTLSSVLVTVAVSLATVFLGAQLFPLVFLIVGWSDACLVYRPSRIAAPDFAFQKVLA